VEADRSDASRTRFAALDPLRPPCRALARHEGSFRSASDHRPLRGTDLTAML